VPTILSHPVVPLTVAVALGSGVVSCRLVAAGAAASILPDLDVVGLRIGIPYGHVFGHRGVTHSLAFAIAVGLCASAFAPLLRASRWVAFMFVAVACASHGLLDMLTNGGYGIAYFWPLSGERYFFSVQPIEVSPLSVRRFLTGCGTRVLLSEAYWLWLPAGVIATSAYLTRRRLSPWRS
jgi:inner membrane protein